MPSLRLLIIQCMVVLCVLLLLLRLMLMMKYFRTMDTVHSRPEGHHRLTSRGRPWDKGLDSIVTETIKKNYQNQYLPWGIIPLLMSVLVTNGWNFKKKIREAYLYKKLWNYFPKVNHGRDIKQFSIIQAFTALWEIKDK